MYWPHSLQVNSRMPLQHKRSGRLSLESRTKREGACFHVAVARKGGEGPEHAVHRF
jgi:hypothetical protein